VLVVVGWQSFAVSGFWALWDNIYERVCCYKHCHGNAVKGFWALKDNIYDEACLLFHIFPSLLTSNLLAVHNVIDLLESLAER
jgi:hypothetical protein